MKKYAAQCTFKMCILLLEGCKPHKGQVRAMVHEIHKVLVYGILVVDVDEKSLRLKVFLIAKQAPFYLTPCSRGRRPAEQEKKINQPIRDGLRTKCSARVSSVYLATGLWGVNCV